MIVELFGMARSLAGATTIDVGGERLTRRELVRALGALLPALVGSVVDLEREDFVEPNLLLLDGRRALDADDPFVASDKPVVLFLASGG
ncbi:MAG: hypothetical protein IAI50_00870 [Candidatus Eremiobacteraeota bacterium]|nr:hypothetical protein [Candidatus Eremiobacteraeota bacterium]